METWKAVPGFENYEVSSAGGIRRSDTKKPMAKQPLNSGYLGCTLHQNGNRWSTTVHRIVATAFIGQPEYKQEINHKDGDKHNNSVENIEWVSRIENERHKYETLQSNGKRKLTKLDVSEIKEMHAKGLGSYTTLSIKFGVCRLAIGHIITGRNWSGQLHK